MPDEAGASEDGASKRKKSPSVTIVPAVAKALDLFEVLAHSPRGLTVAQLAERTSRTIGEIYRIVIYLTERGYLEKHPETDRYVLTLRLFQLASTNAPASQLVQRAMPLLESIAWRTEQSCHVAILSGGNVLVLVSQPSPRHAGYSVRTGASLPLIETSSGAVVLAHASENIRERYLAGLLPSQRREWTERMDFIRVNGFEERESSLVQGVQNLSVPIFDHRGVVAALTMGFIGQTGQRVGVKEALSELLLGASLLSRQLGAPDKVLPSEPSVNPAG